MKSRKRLVIGVADDRDLQALMRRAGQEDNTVSTCGDWGQSKSIGQYCIPGDRTARDLPMLDDGRRGHQ